MEKKERIKLQVLSPYTIYRSTRIYIYIDYTTFVVAVSNIVATTWMKYVPTRDTQCTIQSVEKPPFMCLSHCLVCPQLCHFSVDFFFLYVFQNLYKKKK